MGNKVFATIQKSIWKTNFELLNSKGIKITELVQKKWYSKAMSITTKGYTYDLKWRNNPLLELVLLDQGNEIIVRHYVRGIQSSTGYLFKIGTIG